MAEYIGQCIDLDTIYSDVTNEDCNFVKKLLSDNFAGFRSFIMVSSMIDDDIDYDQDYHYDAYLLFFCLHLCNDLIYIYMI